MLTGDTEECHLLWWTSMKDRRKRKLGFVSFMREIEKVKLISLVQILVRDKATELYYWLSWIHFRIKKDGYDGPTEAVSTL